MIDRQHKKTMTNNEKTKERYLKLLKECEPEMIKVLGRRNYAIIKRRYGFGCDPLPVRKVAARFKVSQTRVSQVEAWCEKKMNTYIDNRVEAQDSRWINLLKVSSQIHYAKTPTR